MIRPDEDANRLLQLNRLLFAGEGTEFVERLSDYVLVREMRIDQAALVRLGEVAGDIRTRSEATPGAGSPTGAADGLDGLSA